MNVFAPPLQKEFLCMKERMALKIYDVDGHGMKKSKLDLKDKK